MKTDPSLPDPKAIPGMSAILKSLPDDLTVLGLEPELTFEWKLAIYDAKIANNIETGDMEAVGRLVEMREAILEEKFELTPDYVKKKTNILKEKETLESALLNQGNTVGAHRVQFEKYRAIFQLQERFLARNYPFRAHVKERLAKWNL